MKFKFSNFSLGAGNMLLIGQAKTGKSTLLKWIAIHFMRNGGSVLYFDVDKGAFVTTKCVGGTHINLDADAGQGIFAPLQTLSEHSVCEVLFTILEAGNVPRTPEIKFAVQSSVKMVKSLDTKEQTISNLIPFIMNDTIRDALKQHTLAEGHNPLFDADTEKLNFDGNWLCLECKRTFESGKKANSCLSYCFSRIEERACNKPLLIIFDDAAVAFKSEMVVAKLPVQINNLRKRNVSFAFAVHQLTDIGNGLKDTLLNHCGTRIYTPNKQILSNQSLKISYQSLGLSDSQLDLLAAGSTRKEYMIQTAEGKSQIIDLMIAPKSASQIITGGSNIMDIGLMEKFIAGYGHDNAVKLYLKKKGA